MRRLQRIVIACTVICFLSSFAEAQPTTLIVHHNANLRADHSTQSAIKDHLEPGDELTTVEPNKTQGFWHVQTAAGVDGWIYQTLVHVEEQDEIPTSPATTGVATSIDPTWTKPPIVGSVLQGPSGQICPAMAKRVPISKPINGKTGATRPRAITPSPSARCKACRSPTHPRTGRTGRPRSLRRSNRSKVSRCPWLASSWRSRNRAGAAAKRRIATSTQPASSIPTLPLSKRRVMVRTIPLWSNRLHVSTCSIRRGSLRHSNRWTTRRIPFASAGSS